MISPINPLKDTPMKSKNINVMSLLFGFAIIANSLTTMVILQRVFGDSTTPSKEPITRLLTPPSKEIR